MKNESVLVFPAEVLNSFDFSNKIIVDQSEVERLYNKLNGKTLFMDRTKELEENPNFKQVIPYCVFSFDCVAKQFLVYQRQKSGGEKRLHNLRSLGIGGHINTVDGDGFFNQYQNGLRREIEEELGIKFVFDSLPKAVIYDDSNDVGKVHVGFVHFFYLNSNTCIRPEISIGNHSFVDAELLKLLDNVGGLENWSSIVFRNIIEKKWS